MLSRRKEILMRYGCLPVLALALVTVVVSIAWLA